MFLINFIIAFLSSGIFLSGYKVYKTKTIRPSRFSMDTVHLSDEASLYIFIAYIIFALWIGRYIVYMYYYYYMDTKDIPINCILFLLILIVVSINFSIYKVITCALIEMLLACFVALLFRKILNRNL